MVQEFSLIKDQYRSYRYHVIETAQVLQFLKIGKHTAFFRCIAVSKQCHISTDQETKKILFNTVMLTYVSIECSKGIKMFVLVIRMRLSESRQVAARRICNTRAETQKTLLVNTSKSDQLCQCSMYLVACCINKARFFICSHQLGNLARSCIGPFRFLTFCYFYPPFCCTQFSQ